MNEPTKGGVMRVYLAGPIEKNCWRHRLVDGLRDVDGRAEWRVLPNAVLGQFDYVGPYFDACDHGCGHGAGSHGVNPESVCSQSFYPGRSTVVGRCLGSVGAADVVFAWIDRPDCHGTAVEIGAALAIGCGVAVGYPDDGRSSAAWFLGVAADLQDEGRIFSGKFPDAISAFRELVLNRIGWFEKNTKTR